MKVDENALYTIKDYSTGYAYGELFFSMFYMCDDKIIGELNYGEYEEEPNVKMIQVLPEYRRQGVAKKLLQELQLKYPNKEINFGMLTPDGMKLIESVTYTVENTEVIQKLSRIENIKQKLSDYDKGFDNYYENDLPIPENYAEDYDDLYNELRDLQKEVNGKKTIKTFVKMKAEIKPSLSDLILSAETKLRVPHDVSDGKKLHWEQER